MTNTVRPTSKQHHIYYTQPDNNPNNLITPITVHRAQQIVTLLTNTINDDCAFNKPTHWRIFAIRSSLISQLNELHSTNIKDVRPHVIEYLSLDKLINKITVNQARQIVLQLRNSESVLTTNEKHILKELTKELNATKTPTKRTTTQKPPKHEEQSHADS